jgi:transcription factor SPN1
LGKLLCSSISRDFSDICSAAQLALRPSALPTSQSQSQNTPMSQRELERERFLANPIKINRARLEAGTASYSIAPRSNLENTKEAQRPIGAGGMEAFRKMTAKQGKKRS